MSVLLGSLTVRVPVLVSPAFVSTSDALVLTLERPLAVILKLSMDPAKVLAFNPDSNIASSITNVAK